MGGSVRSGIRLNASNNATFGSAHHPEVPSPPDSHTGTPLLVAMANTRQRQLKDALEGTGPQRQQREGGQREYGGGQRQQKESVGMGTETPG